MRPRKQLLVLALTIGACGGKVTRSGPVGEEIKNLDDAAPGAPEVPVEIDASAPEPAPEAAFEPAPTSRRDAVAIECAVLRNGHLDTFTLPGARRTAGPAVALDTFDITSMGKMGSALYACSSSGGDGVVVQIASNDGNVSRSSVGCVAATADRDGIVVLRRDPLGSSIVYFEDWAHVLESSPSATHEYGSNVSRLAPFFDQIVGAWHVARSVSVSARSDAGSLGERLLERASDRVEGIGLVPDGRLLLTSPGGGIDVFDAFTGTWLEQHGGSRSAPSDLSAIACDESSRPRIDSCEGKTDGTYCSELEYRTAFSCANGAVTGTLRCMRGACQTDATDRAIVRDGRLACVPRAPAD